MTSFLESEKNRKALTYTAIICGALLILFILISWDTPPPPKPPVVEFFEVNLGNNDEGLGEEQPEIKGSPSPVKETEPAALPSPAKETQAEDDKVTPEDNPEKEAVAVNKAEKKVPIAKIPVPPAPVVPKPVKPKYQMDGAVSKTNGNSDKDNGYTMQGKNPNGKGDAGVPNGNKDSYGNTPGGKAGGPKVISGNRKVVNYYTFPGDLPKAIINAIVKVTPEGTGTFIGFAKGSTSNSRSYADAIAGYLKSMKFDKAEYESTVTLQFNFQVKN